MGHLSRGCTCGEVSIHFYFLLQQAAFAVDKSNILGFIFKLCCRYNLRPASLVLCCLCVWGLYVSRHLWLFFLTGFLKIILN